MEKPLGPRSTRTEPLEGFKMYKSVKLPPPLAPYKMLRLCAWDVVAARKRIIVAAKAWRRAVLMRPRFYPFCLVAARAHCVRPRRTSVPPRFDISICNFAPAD